MQTENKKMTVFGCGPIGLINTIGFSQAGYQVLAYDINTKKIQNLSDAKYDLYEPGLKENLQLQLLKKNITFTSEFLEAVAFSSIDFIALGTPSSPDGSADTKQIEFLLLEITQHACCSKTIFLRSTVPPGTTRKLQKQTNDLLKKLDKKIHIQLIHHPEFLREGTALEDFKYPDRLVFGAEFVDKNLIFKLYPTVLPEKILFTTWEESELIKYASNTYLAQRISFINEIARLAEKVNANIQTIKKGISLDPRIGESFLNAGLGFGGSCFPKDLKALISFAGEHNELLPLARATLTINELQISRWSDKINNYFHLHSNLERVITLWGASFKPNTSDLRESQSLKLINRLLELGFKIKIYDPVCFHELNEIYSTNKNVMVHSAIDSSLENSNALVLATEWDQFQKYGLESIKTKLSHLVVFDTRNLFDPLSAQELGFKYFGAGQ